jgi:hypothetical protein
VPQCVYVCVCVCVYYCIPITKLFARVGGGKVEDMCYERRRACVCFITAGPITKLCAWGEDEPRPVALVVRVYYCRTYYSVCLLLQYLFYLCAVDAHHIYSDVCVYYFIAFWGIVRKHEKLCVSSRNVLSLYEFVPGDIEIH